MRYQNKLGGINQILPMVGELREETTQNDLEDLLHGYEHKAILKRLGYLISEVSRISFLKS
ncbi:type IV toxin-antitoxin system AbiEi family antitoxin [Gillisia limnaea]|uniref:Uncharacterized protein n=1 Tax=Gillisia limnaea (strain DSM 15749 / LMG 21470 / R-8282) TaxID=865937 RepID=H2BR33_GILLR|nr:type IV toxin-antitoxin system AbiEi family antitoxin [Gillisia limnaea]EHQ04352.1 hypothetical protein Gilli_0199 [Gillisia limnaea DSM 15749]